MRILLVRTARIKQAITLGEFMFCEPIGLEMVYTALSPDHQVEIFDMMVEKASLEEKLLKFAPQVVGITSLCIDVNAVLEAARLAKEYSTETITIVGGTQAYLNPGSFFSENIDYIFKFTTQDNLQQLFSVLATRSYPSQPIAGIGARADGYAGVEAAGRNEYFFPNRQATAKYRSAYSYFGFRPAAIIGSAQGCSKGCHYCLRWRLEGSKEVYFPMDFVLADLRQIKEKTIMIFDNDFLHNGERLEKFCDALEREGIQKNFICYGSVVSVLANQGQIQRFSRLGLQAILIGYESFSNRELQAYGKNSTKEDNLRVADFLRKIGVDVWASFMLHPAWSKADFRSFRKYLRQLRPQISSMSPLTPFPNLPLYKEFQEQLLVSSEDFEKWSFGQLTIRPSSMRTNEYYWEMLKTNLYINLYLNNLPYIVHKFGIASVWHLGKGSIKVLGKYIQLMKNCKG